MGEEIDLPKGWKWVKIREIAANEKYAIVDGPFGTQMKVHEFVSQGIPLIEMQNIDENKFKNEFRRYVTKEKYQQIKRSSVKPRDIIISKTGSLGYVAQLPDDFKLGIITSRLAKISIDWKFIEKGYLLNYLNHLREKGYWVKIAKGTTMKILNVGQLKETLIPLPPKETQQAIVSKIEELFSELDKGIENLKTAQQQLKIYRQSVLKWAFEGKLTNKNVKEGELPKGWKWAKISELCKVVRGGSPRPAGDPKYYDGKIPFLKVADLTNDEGVYLTKYKYTIKEAGLHKTRKIAANTLLLSNSGATLGVPKICMIDATMNDGIAAFLDLDVRSNHYLYYFWVSKTRALRNINMGAAQPNLNTDLIKDYDLPYCSINEQQMVVQAIESRLSVADKLEESINESLQQADALRQSILKKAFEGKLVAVQKEVEAFKPKNTYLYQVQILAYITNSTNERKLPIGEMVTAKYAYLIDKLYNIPTYYNYKRWHLGPYPPEINKALKKRQFFKIHNHHIKVADKRLLGYDNPYKQKATNAINELLDVFSKYSDKERSHKIELLATVCKVIEDIKSTELKQVRESMKEWKIKLDNSSFKNKAEKFNERETQKCIEFITEKGWHKKLMV